ncbi:UNVERIFIED_CONTAM: Cyp18a1 [Trichonephila clavipes]
MQKLMKWYNIQRKGPSGPVGLPVVGYLPFLGKEPHKTFRKMTEKYGDIIGLYLGQKYTIVLNEYNVAKEVLCNAAALDRSPDIFSHLGDIGFLAENGETWVEQRRYCLSATRDLGLGRGHWEDLIMDEASSFMKYLTDLKGRPADISHAMASSITSNIISLLIGRRLKRHEEADKVERSIDYSDIAFTYTGPSYATAAIPGLRMFCEKFKIAGYDKAFEIIQKFSSFIRYLCLFFCISIET